MTARLSTAAAVFASLALAACATTSAAPPIAGVWRLQASATTGAALVLAEGAPGAPHDVLRLACRRNPADLYLASDRLKPTKAAVRLQVGAHAFDLRPYADEPRLAASAPMPDALPAALLDGGPIRVTAGRQTLEGLPTPDGKIVAAFVISCRAETATG